MYIYTYILTPPRVCNPPLRNPLRYFSRGAINPGTRLCLNKTLKSAERLRRAAQMIS